MRLPPPQQRQEQSPGVNVLERELKQIKSAFQTYISSSKQLEEGMDKEMREMRAKLAQATEANRIFESQLSNIEPIVLDLEFALEETKSRLMQEQQLRQKAEISCLEAEKKMEYIRDDIGSNRSIGSIRRARLTSALVSTHLEDDAYVEILDELETVTEQLIDTQRRLNETEDKLKNESAKVLELQKDGDELELVKEELSLAHEELRDAEEDPEAEKQREEKEQQVARIQLLENMLREKNSKLELSEENLKKSTEDLNAAKDENSKHVEELTCLRDALHEAIKNRYEGETGVEVLEGPATTEEEMRETITKEVRLAVLKENRSEREKEINVLREKFKTLFKDNSVLQKKVDDCEQAALHARGLKEEVPKLKEEISHLKAALNQANEKLGPSGPNNEDSPVELQRSLTASKSENNKTMTHLKTCQGDLKASREDILKLKEMIHSLNESLEESHATTEQYREALDECQADLSCVTEELKESRQLCEALEENSRLSDDENARLQDRLHSLNIALDKSEHEYSEILSQLEVATAKARQFQGEESLGRNRLDQKDLEGLKGLSSEEFTRSSHMIDGQANQSMEMLEDENGSLKLMLYEAEATAATLRAELGSARTQISSLKADLIEYEANFKISESPSSRGALYSRPLVMSEETEGAIEDLQDAGNSRRAFKLEPQADRGDDSNEVGKLKLSLLFSKDEAIILKRQVEKLKASLDQNIVAHAEELEKLHQSLDPTSDGSHKNASESTTKDTEARLQEEQDPERKDFVTVLLEENGFLQEKLEATEKSLNAMEDRHKMKEEMMKMYEVGFVSYEETLNCSADETSKLREEISDLKNALEIAKTKGHGDSGNVKALQAMLKSTDESLKELQKQLGDSKASHIKTEAQKAELEKEIATLKNSLSEARQHHNAIAEELDSVKLQCDELRKTVGPEKLEEVRSQMIEERANELKTLQKQLEKVGGEKAALQNKVDDAKIAMSVSQYAQEKSKEDLRTCEAELESSRDEVFLLRKEAAKANALLARIRNDYALVMEELQSVKEGVDDAWRKPDDSMDELAEIENKLKKATHENSELEFKIEGLANALAASQRELEIKNDKLESTENQLQSKIEMLASMESSLSSSRDETKMLTEEISHLSLTLENTKIEYDAVVDELEAVNELFDETRKDAEKCGRKAAAEEIRREVNAASDYERKQLKEQLKKILEDNVILQRKLDEAEMSLVVARNMQQRNKDGALAQTEVKRLQEEARLSADEIRNLKEKMFGLNVDLTDAKKDADIARDELEATKRVLECFRQESAGVEVPRAGSPVLPTEQQLLREQIRQLIAENSSDTKSDSSGSNQSDENFSKIKSQVLNLCVALEKSLTENAAFREQLDKAKQNIEKARAEGEKVGVITATKEVRDEMKLQRVRQMNDFKQQLRTSPEERAVLRQKVDDAETALAAAKESESRIRDELSTLTEDLMASKVEARRFQEDAATLTMELESANINRSRVVEEIRADIETNRDGKIKALNHQLHGLTIENGTLQRKLKNTKAALNTTQNAKTGNREETDALHKSLQASQKTTLELQDEISSLKLELEKTQRDYKIALESLPEDLSILDVNSKDMESDLSPLKSALESKSMEIRELNEKLLYSEEEIISLKSQISTLNNSLQQSKEDLRTLTHQFNAACGDAVKQGRDAASNEFRAQEQAERAAEIELSECKTELQSSRLEVATLQDELDKRNTELLDATTKELSAIVEDAMHALHDPMGPESEEELKKMKEKLDAFSMEKILLERKVEETENALSLAQESQEKQKKVIAVCEEKLKTWKKEALHLRGEVAKLKSALGNANKGHVYLRDQLETVNKQVLNLCTEAEERGRAAAIEEIRTGFVAATDAERQTLADQLARLHDTEAVPTNLEATASDFTDNEKNQAKRSAKDGKKQDADVKKLQAHFDRTKDEIAKIDQEMEKLGLLEETQPRANKNNSNNDENATSLETKPLEISEAAHEASTEDKPKNNTHDGQSGKNQSETRDDVNVDTHQHTTIQENSRSNPQISQEMGDGNVGTSPKTSWEAKAEAKKKRWKEKLEMSRSRRKGKSQTKSAQNEGDGTDTVAEAQVTITESEGRE